MLNDHGAAAELQIPRIHHLPRRRRRYIHALVAFVGDAGVAGRTGPVPDILKTAVIAEHQSVVGLLHRLLEYPRPHAGLAVGLKQGPDGLLVLGHRRVAARQGVGFQIYLFKGIVENFHCEILAVSPRRDMDGVIPVLPVIGHRNIGDELVVPGHKPGRPQIGLHSGLGSRRQPRDAHRDHLALLYRVGTDGDVAGQVQSEAEPVIVPARGLAVEGRPGQAQSGLVPAVAHKGKSRVSGGIPVKYRRSRLVGDGQFGGAVLPEIRRQCQFRPAGKTAQILHRQIPRPGDLLFGDPSQHRQGPVVAVHRQLGAAEGNTGRGQILGPMPGKISYPSLLLTKSVGALPRKTLFCAVFPIIPEQGQNWYHVRPFRGYLSSKRNKAGRVFNKFPDSC